MEKLECSKKVINKEVLECIGENSMLLNDIRIKKSTKLDIF
jgi:hypothetical protein